jgi:uncharacterized protein (DUF302 family)
LPQEKLCTLCTSAPYHCNVIVYETDDGKAYIAAINTISALQVIHNQELRTIAGEVAAKLKRAVEKITV